MSFLAAGRDAGERREERKPCFQETGSGARHGNHRASYSDREVPSCHTDPPGEYQTPLTGN